MNRAQKMLIVIITAVLGFSATAYAEDCAGTSKIGEGEQIFSVKLPKVSGMTAQSFNDIGCAVRSRNEECASRSSLFDSNAIVYDYRSGEQILAENAYFVMKTGVKTPHGYGIVAFKDKTEAEKFSAAHENGKVVKWFELVEEKLK